MDQRFNFSFSYDKRNVPQFCAYIGNMLHASAPLIMFSLCAMYDVCPMSTRDIHSWHICVMLLSLVVELVWCWSVCSIWLTTSVRRFMTETVTFWTPLTAAASTVRTISTVSLRRQDFTTRLILHWPQILHQSGISNWPQHQSLFWHQLTSPVLHRVHCILHTSAEHGTLLHCMVLFWD